MQEDQVPPSCVRSWKSLSLAFPWCSRAFGDWTVWWHHRAWAAAPAGSWPRPSGVGHWGAEWLPGSSVQLDTRTREGGKWLRGAFKAFLQGRQKSSSTYANDFLMSGGILWKQFSNLYKQTKITRKEKKRFACSHCIRCTLKRAGRQVGKKFSSLTRKHGLHRKTW